MISLMIENPNPRNWRSLQIGVCTILSEIGLATEVGKVIDTARGKVELDVFGIDEQSEDKIKYVIECKNWTKTVPQTVVHSFTTIMHECGANIGFIVSKKGLQPGAQEYTKHTNIVGLSYADFQSRYLAVWFARCFVTKIGDAVDPLSQYVEPFNSRRDKEVDQLSKKKQKRYFTLLKKYQVFGMTMAFYEFPRYAKHMEMALPKSIEEIKGPIEKSLNGSVRLKSTYLRDLMKEIILLVRAVTEEFNSIFGKNIFA